MPMLFIHARNSVFHASDEGAEYPVAGDALASGVRSAVAIVADEVGQGAQSAAVEVSVETASGVQVLRAVVSVSVAPLIIGTVPDRSLTGLSGAS